MIDIVKGPAAIKVGKYWVGVASGNQWCKKRRRKPDKAIKDAKKLEPTT